MRPAAKAGTAGKFFATIACVIALLPTPATADDGSCVDMVVIAKLKGQTSFKDMPAPPGSISFYGLAGEKIEVEHVLYGKPPSRLFEIQMVEHSEYNPRVVRHILFFLHHDAEGYFSVARELNIVRDAEGRFVFPVTRPLGTESIYPESWIPADYRNFLRPIKYRAQDAWWIETDQKFYEKQLDPEWLVRRGKHLIALKGLGLDEMAPYLALRDRNSCHK